MGKGKKYVQSGEKKPGAANKHRRLPLALAGIVVLVAVALLLLRPRQPQLELPPLSADSIVVLDADSGSVRYEKAGDTPRSPSSLTKLMTAYLLFEDLEQGVLTLGDTHRVTGAQAEATGSKYGLRPGMTVTVEQLLAGVILNSGCDCVQCLVTLSAGGETDFVSRMNSMADAMGLKGSRFSNATGLDAADHYTTARDLAELSRRLVEDYPAYLDYSSQPTLSVDGLEFQNLHLLVGRDPRVQGLKTGTTSIGGNNLVTYASSAGERYIIVLLGSASEQRRFAETQTILDVLYGEGDHG